MSVRRIHIERDDYRVHRQVVNRRLRNRHSLIAQNLKQSLLSCLRVSQGYAKFIRTLGRSSGVCQLTGTRSKTFASKLRKMFNQVRRYLTKPGETVKVGNSLTSIRTQKIILLFRLVI